MNAAQYAAMVETEHAPCGCRVEFNSGPGEPEGHTCFHDEHCAYRPGAALLPEDPAADAVVQQVLTRARVRPTART